jgi:hypothetical protein
MSTNEMAVSLMREEVNHLQGKMAELQAEKVDPLTSWFFFPAYRTAPTPRPCSPHAGRGA